LGLLENGQRKPVHYLHSRVLSVTGSPSASSQAVDYGYVRIDIHGLSVQHCGTKFPLTDCAQRGSMEERIPADYLQRPNGPVRADDGVKLDAPFTACLYGQWRIQWLDAMR
jgi:hypothetical protein